MVVLAVKYLANPARIDRVERGYLGKRRGWITLGILLNSAHNIRSKLDTGYSGFTHGLFPPQLVRKDT